MSAIPGKKKTLVCHGFCLPVTLKDRDSTKDIVVSLSLEVGGATGGVVHLFGFFQKITHSKQPRDHKGLRRSFPNYVEQLIN